MVDKHDIKLESDMDENYVYEETENGYFEEVIEAEKEEEFEVT